MEANDFADLELTYGNQNLLVQFSNLSDKVVPISESYITAVTVMAREIDSISWNAELVLPGNIVVGSTLDDVFAAYGDIATWMTAFEETSSLAVVYSSDYFYLSININTDIDSVVMISYWANR